MIQITLIYLSLLTLSLIVSVFRKQKINTLNCGIFGFAGIPGKGVDLKKISILGVFNIQRGKDNCGYYWSGNIKKGVDKEANWQTFIHKNKLERGSLKGEIFLGHTRKTTSGGNIEASAHPHEIGNYVQTHNGSLRNHWELCNKHKIDHNKISVDSIALAHIIQKDGFEVLNEYVGAAALAFTFTDDNNTMYLYHGASKETNEGQLIEERPLYYLLQPEGIYYSSILESLDFISNTNDTAIMLPHNSVYKITNGEIDKEFKYIVHRETVNIPKYVVQNYTNTNYGKQVSMYECNVNNNPNIFKESLPLEFKTQDLFYRYGRFISTKTLGLLNGIYNINRQGKFIKEPTSTKDVYYFVRGIMVKSLKDYNALSKDINKWVDDKDCIFAKCVSRYSKYPVASLPGEGKFTDYASSYWFYESTLARCTMDIKFASRTYSLKFGSLEDINLGKIEKNATKYYPNYAHIGAFKLDEASASVKINTNNNITKIVKEVQQWANAPITSLEVIKDAPESFIVLLEQYNELYYGIEMDESEKSEYLMLLLDEFIAFDKTFYKYCFEYGDEKFLDEDNLTNIFKKLNVEEIANSENRFLSFDFDEYIEDNNEDIKEVAKLSFNKLLYDAKNKFVELKSLADDIQRFDDIDNAQNLAYELYKCEEPISKLIDKSIKEIGMPF